MNSPRYSIRITYPSGTVAYMEHRGRRSWCKRSAQKHLAEWVQIHGIPAALELSDA